MAADGSDRSPQHPAALTSKVTASSRVANYKAAVRKTGAHPIRMIVPTVLTLLAAIHALPVLGVLNAARLSQLYGITVQGAELTLLLPQRAVAQ